MPNSSKRSNSNSNLVDEESRNPNLAGQSMRRVRRSFVEIAERAPAERQRAWQQRQRVERWVTVDISRKIGASAQRVAQQTATCHEFNVRVSRKEATFEEWASFLGDLYRKFNRFIDLQFHPTILREVENLVILGWFIYGDNRLKPVLSELGMFLKIYLDENGAHNILQLNTQTAEGPLPENDPVFHFLPYRHGSFEDITRRVGLMPSIPLEIVSTMDDRICSICYNEFEFTHEGEGEGEGASSSDSSEPVPLPMKLPCGHAFHSACITPWLALNTSCPLCRHRAFPDL